MSYDVQFSRQPPSALFDLKGSPDRITDWAGEHLPPLPARPNSLTTDGDRSLCFIGHNHWLLHAPLAEEMALSEALKPTAAPEDISIVRVSDTLAFFDVTGPDADQIMAIACPLDLHPSVFAEDSVTYTEIFGQKGLVRRMPDGFTFAVEQSFATLIMDYLNRAVA